MKTQVAATFTNGQFKPDQDVPLPEDTRVNLTVEVVEDESDSEEEFHGDPKQSMAAWESLKEWIRQHPLHGLGRRLTRDELHERR